ncbi:MAG: pacearchaeosortase [Nanoarchaeota archaeon]
MKKRAKRKENKPENVKSSDNIPAVLIRYLILLGLMFSLPLIYRIFAPLTMYPVVWLLKIFYNVSLSGSFILINLIPKIELIPACIAGSAYLLLLILNLTVPMKIKKRIYSIILSFLLLLILNILRIFFLAILYHNNFAYFDITHKFFWYFLSTIFVVGIWLFIAKIFAIKEIPVYSDIKGLMKDLKKK